MSINTLCPTELMEQRKITSDRKNNTNALTHANSGLDSSHGKARQKREAIQDKLDIKALETQTDDDYFYSLIEEF